MLFFYFFQILLTQNVTCLGFLVVRYKILVAYVKSNLVTQLMQNITVITVLYLSILSQIGINMEEQSVDLILICFYAFHYC